MPIMTKRSAECFLSERAVAFSVDALLGHIGKDSSHEEKKINKKQDSDAEEVPGSKGNSTGPVTKQAKYLALQTGDPEVQVELQGADLWAQFHRLGNEMIITKSGRRIFPALKVKVSGLDPESHYILWADIIAVDGLRYRYVYPSSQWMVAGTGETQPRASVYVHPDSPAPGQQWLSQVVTFDKLKLTNTKHPLAKGQVALHSMHKYRPRIHVQRTDYPDCDPQLQTDISQAVSFTFPETEFITVTAYQNQQITKLKIASNPFAKGFREVANKSHEVRDDVAKQCSSFTHQSNLQLGEMTLPLADNAFPTTGVPFSLNWCPFVFRQDPFFHPPLPYSTPEYGSTLPLSMPDQFASLRSHPHTYCFGVRSFSDPQMLAIPPPPLVSLDPSPSTMFRFSSASPVTGWKPAKEDKKPTARVAPNVLQTPDALNRDVVSTWFPQKES